MKQKPGLQKPSAKEESNWYKYVTRTSSPPAVGKVMRERLNALFAKDKSR